MVVQRMVYVDSFTPDPCILRCACFNHQPCEFLNVVPSLNVTILLNWGAPLFSFILSCDMTLLLYQDIACIARQNVLKHFACLAKRLQTKLLSNQGFTVLVFSRLCTHGNLTNTPFPFSDHNLVSFTVFFFPPSPRSIKRLLVETFTTLTLPVSILHCPILTWPTLSTTVHTHPHWTHLLL